MAIDIIGPGQNTPHVTTTRPADDAEYGVLDTWFKDCTSPEEQDGTKIKASFMNRVSAQLRRAIRGMGIAEDNENDDMLLEAIKKAGSTSTIINQFAAYLPMFPEIQTVDGKMALTASTGQIVINAGQTWLHRGAFQKSTDDYDIPARTFSTVANNTYHLRWKWNGPSTAPAFYLRDLADAGYNPGGDAEAHVKFDTTFDDMLIAKIVTNGANALTVTPLVNKVTLALDLTYNGGGSAIYPGNIPLGPDGVVPGSFQSPTHAINWSRRPTIQWQEYSLQATDDDVSPDSGPLADYIHMRFKATRYTARPLVYPAIDADGVPQLITESAYRARISA
jgi:hypothetical protein